MKMKTNNAAFVVLVLLAALGLPGCVKNSAETAPQEAAIPVPVTAPAVDEESVVTDNTPVVVSQPVTSPAVTAAPSTQHTTPSAPATEETAVLTVDTPIPNAESTPQQTAVTASRSFFDDDDDMYMNAAIARYNMGAIYAQKKDFDKAIENFTQAIKLDPNYADAYNVRGSAYLAKKDYVLARADWEKALQINPNHTDARDNLEILRQQGY
jgi:tetratricopeptide (TPR) repeat protein